MRKIGLPNDNMLLVNAKQLKALIFKRNIEIHELQRGVFILEDLIGEYNNNNKPSVI